MGDRMQRLKGKGGAQPAAGKARSAVKKKTRQTQGVLTVAPKPDHAPR